MQKNTELRNDYSANLSRRGFCRTAALTTGLAALTPCKPLLAKESQKSKTPVVDTHMHVWANDADKYPFPHPYAKDYQGPEYEGTMEMLIDDMDANGVTHSILVQVIFHGWDNTYVADCVRKWPDRCKAHGLIDPTDPNVADKLTYWMTEHPLSGMRFSPIYYREGRHGGDDWITSAAHEKLWKQAEKLGAVFNFFIATQQLSKLETMVARFPGVPIIIDHMSQVDLAADDAEEEFAKLLKMAQYPNVWVKVSELSSTSASKKYPFPDAWPWVKRLYEAFGPDQLLWGTGYPGSARAAYKRPTLAKELELIRETIPCFTKEDRVKILGGNAAKLWKL